MGWLDSLLKKPGKKTHKLKWPLPELRLTIPLEDVQGTLAKLKQQHTKFLGGGEFVDVVHAKQYGKGIFAYYTVRTDKKTEEERLLFDGYMLEEEEKLSLDVTVSQYITRDLEDLGYKPVFAREVTERRFLRGVLRLLVIEVKGFGAFLEIALPQTKVDKGRKMQEKMAESLIKKLEFKKEDVIPTDVTTLQMLSEQQAGQGEAPAEKGKSAGFGGSDFKLGK